MEGTIAAVSFDGDFFADSATGSDASLRRVERAVDGMPVLSALQDFQERIVGAIPGDVRLIGMDARSLALAVRGACGMIAGASGKAGTGTALSSSESQMDDDRRPTRGLGARNPHAEAPGQPLRGSDPGNLTSPNLSLEEIRRRWNALDLTILDPEESARYPYSPQMQMALDEIVSRETAQGRLPALVRFWEWKSPAVIIGLFQSLHAEVDVEEARRLGITVVRRCTGGGAMFVEPGNTITYSLTAPLGFIAGLNAEDAYRLCEAWTIGALWSLGIRAEHEPINDISSPAGKIGGAAQRRFPSPGHEQTKERTGRKGQAADALPGAVLHHTTMAYDIDAVKMGRVLTPDRAKLAAHAVTSAAKRVDPMRSQTGLSRTAIVRAMADWLRAFVPSARTVSLPRTVLEQAEELARTKYSDPAWMGRIE